MPSTPAIITTVTITSKSLDGISVAKTFNNVIGLSFDYFKGMINLIDSVQGQFYFPLIPVTIATSTIAGNTTTIVIS